MCPAEDYRCGNEVALSLGRIAVWILRLIQSKHEADGWLSDADPTCKLL